MLNRFNRPHLFGSASSTVESHRNGVAQERMADIDPKLTRASVAVSGLTKRFSKAEIPAVSDLSFSINPGQTLAILGPSGSGKTTTLRLIAGFEVPDSGEIRIGEQIVASPGRSLPTEKRGLGMVFQQFALFPHLTVEQNVGYGLAAASSEEKAKRVDEGLRLVGMEGYKKRYPHQLSGGQQQRVALARALTPRPVLLLMDEPFGSLDATMRSEMRREVKSILVQTNTTTILVTHDKEEAFTLADNVLLMNDGRLQQLDTPDNIYHKPISKFVAEFVGLADFIPAQREKDGVVTELGNFPYKGTIPQGDFDILVRPDDIEFKSDAQGQSTIIAREFKGATNLYAIRLPSGRTVWSAQPSQVVHRINDRVSAYAILEHVVIYPR